MRCGSFGDCGDGFVHVSENGSVFIVVLGEQWRNLTQLLSRLLEHLNLLA